MTGDGLGKIGRGNARPIISFYGSPARRPCGSGRAAAGCSGRRPCFEECCGGFRETTRRVPDFPTIFSRLQRCTSFRIPSSRDRARCRETAARRSPVGAASRDSRRLRVRVVSGGAHLSKRNSPREARKTFSSKRANVSAGKFFRAIGIRFSKRSGIEKKKRRRAPLLKFFGSLGSST